MKQMRQKKNNKNGNPRGTAWIKKTVAGLVFAAACFIAAFVLVEFHEIYPAVIGAGVVLLGAAYFLLSELFREKADVWSTLKEDEEDAKEKREAEFQKKIEAQVESLDRTGKAVFAAIKKNAEAQEEQVKELEKKLNLLMEEQSSGIKTIVKFNKENARQVAITERESMEHVLSEITKEKQSEREQYSELIEKVADALRNMELQQKQTTEPKSEPEEEIKPVQPEPEPEIEDVPEVIEPEHEEIPELTEAEPSVEAVASAEAAEQEELSAKKNLDDLITELGDDPNAALSAEDIAKLFAASGN